MRKRIMTVFSCLLMCLVIFQAVPSMAMIVPLQMVQQQQTNWCWAGSTSAIESFYSRSNSQCEMANYLLTRLYGYLPDNCCRYAPLSLPNTNPPHLCNQGNYLLTSERVGNVQEIMNNNYTTPNSGVASSLSQADVQTEIYAGRPFEMRWDWLPWGSGAHALVGYGLTGNMMNYMDPWPWNPQSNAASYTSVVSNASHIWTQTVRPSITPQPPIPDVKANGMDGNISVSHTTPVNVTCSLNPGAFTNTQADLWIAGYFYGLLYYYYFDTSSSTWRWTTQARPAAQGGLVSLTPFSIIYGTVPAGTSMTFYFAVDLTMNGVLDNPYYIDYVTITGY